MNKIDLLVTGVGVPATLYQLQKKINEKKYGCVIQAGIAGSFLSSIKIGDVVIVKQDVFADIGMEENNIFTSIYKTNFVDKNELPYSNGWLINNGTLFNTQQLNAVKAVTVNKVSDSEMQRQQLINNFNPGIETMEGAALHFVCLQEKTEFIQIRSISNEVSVRDKSKWKVKEAIQNLNASLGALIETIHSLKRIR